MSVIMDEPLMTAAEVAALLHVSVPSVFRWARLGLLPSVRLGIDTVRFEPSAVRSFILDGAARGASA
jgi:excisionase family DNA binding protein